MIGDNLGQQRVKPVKIEIFRECLGVPGPLYPQNNSDNFWPWTGLNSGYVLTEFERDRIVNKLQLEL